MELSTVSSQQMSLIDRRAREEYGIPEAILMENAGISVSDRVVSDSSSINKEKIAILCGKGNNGGDGFVIARHLADRSSARITVFVPDDPNIREGCARDNFEIVHMSDITIKPYRDFTPSEINKDPYTIFIDAIFGTGFKGELTGEHARLAELYNNAEGKHYAVDIPSGLDGTSGIVKTLCFKAEVTITFGLPKNGFFLADGPGACGEVVVENIGFPKELLDEYTVAGA